MQLETFFTMWGWRGSAAEAVYRAHELGYNGVEGQAPSSEPECAQFIEALNTSGLKYIQEIPTTGRYVPDRRLSVDDHLHHLQKSIAAGSACKPLFVNCLGGCDAWPDEDCLDFFNRAIAIGQELNTELSFETHRGRILFNPWRCQWMCERIENLQLTFDISHWCVVCEGLQETELELIHSLADRARHIHARVGYDQGPQVPDPSQGVYQQDLDMHLALWQNWFDQGRQSISMTPEFGVDGYEYRSLDGLTALVDPVELNAAMQRRLRSRFSQAFCSH